MKEKIQKLVELNKEVAELIKDEKMDDAIAKLDEVQELTKTFEVKKEVEKEDKKEVEDVKKDEESEEVKKTMEEMSKYVSLNITAESIKGLMEDFNELKTTITKNEEILNDRLEKIENAKSISKQSKEENISKENSVWDGLGIL